jgi:hypothetical protein
MVASNSFPMQAWREGAEMTCLAHRSIWPISKKISITVKGKYLTTQNMSKKKKGMPERTS